MRLRGKTVLILIVTLVLASFFVVAGLQRYFENRIKGIENEDAEKALHRAAALVDDDLDQLDILVRDWAFWDDTWSYVEKRNAEYAASNLIDAGLDSLEISALLILDTQGGVIATVPKSGPRLDAIAASYRHKQPPTIEGRRGVLAIGGEVYLVAARPIRRSGRGGETRGTLVMARILDEKRMERYSRLSDLAVRILPRSGDKTAKALPVISFGSRSIEADMPIVGSDGTSSAEIHIKLPWSAEENNSRSLIAVLVGVVLIVAFVGMLAVLVFEVAVLGRMRAIGTELVGISKDVGAGAHLKESGNDELTLLVRTMNAALDSLYTTIRERDSAMREIHHRVKNNLQIITSLINLQIGGAETEETADALRPIGRRVLAMALIHEELYIDNDIERVDGEEFFRRIASAIQQSLGSDTRIDVSIDCDCDDIGLMQATSIGLIACEVLANSYVHAFPAGREGLIHISMRRAAGGGSELIISDDGIGFDGEWTKGLGMNLIEALVNQIDARYGYARGPQGGTLFKLEIPPEGSSTRL